MTEVDYGVVLQDGAWRIIGEGLRFGSYASRFNAERAARRLANQSSVPVRLHVQDETGELRPPAHLDVDL